MKAPKAQELIKEIEANLPLPVYPTPELAQSLRQKGVAVRMDEALQVTSVFDSGDMGGIMCAVESKNKREQKQKGCLCDLADPPAHRSLSKSARPQVVAAEMMIVCKTGPVAKLKGLGA